MSFVKYLVVVLIFLTCAYFMIMFCDRYTKLITFQYDIETIEATKSPIFDSYLKKFNKSYSDDEYKIRLSYFRDSMKLISKLNRETGARHGWTKFTDMSKEEISKFVLIQDNEPECHSHHTFCTSDENTTIIPQSIAHKVDWRTKNVISPVVNQLRCAACWAISIVQTMESMSGIRGYGTNQLSIQELLDCSTYNTGCNGGNMQAMEYLCHNHLDVTTAENYPLTFIKSKCQTSLIHGGRWLKDYTINCPMAEYDMLRILTHHGPIIVVVNALPLMSYIDGIVQRNCMRSHDGNDLMHMVQIVGYDLTGDVPYYIVKNSWGVEYGEEGYLKLVINKNICGVADQVAYLDVY